mmetsp:Transcript_26776/g.77930  ORF Transcript_26776/g.77930 Transcript_26776/m.77930 type:complete len:387 (+) Transcript_26776:107-1267(+)
MGSDVDAKATQGVTSPSAKTIRTFKKGIQRTRTWAINYVLVPLVLVMGFVSLGTLTKPSEAYLFYMPAQAAAIGYWCSVLNHYIATFGSIKELQVRREGPQTLCIVLATICSGLCASIYSIVVHYVYGKLPRNWEIGGLLVLAFLDSVATAFAIYRAPFHTFVYHALVNVFLYFQVAATVVLALHIADLESWDLVILCLLYPGWVLALRFPATFCAKRLSHSVVEVTEVQSTISASLPYRIVFFALDRWIEAIIVILVEVTWKVIVHIFGVKHHAESLVRSSLRTSLLRPPVKSPMRGQLQHQASASPNRTTSTDLDQDTPPPHCCQGSCGGRARISQRGGASPETAIQGFSRHFHGWPRRVRGVCGNAVDPHFCGDSARDELPLT